MPAFVDHMRDDVDALMAHDPTSTSRLHACLLHSGMRAVWAYRRQHWLWERGTHALASWLAMRSRRKFGIEIHPAATIGRRFVIDHGMGTVIGSTTVIGDDCIVYQGVTLGAVTAVSGKRHPTLGSGVMVGAGAKVLGDITVGDGAKVGAGAVVVDDVAAGATVVGVPARATGHAGRAEVLSLVDSAHFDGERPRRRVSVAAAL